MAVNRTLYNLIKRTSKDDLLKMSLKYCRHGHTVLSHPKCFIEETLPERVGIIDIETSDLTANFGYMLSWSILDLETGQIERDLITQDEIHSTDQLDLRIVDSLIMALYRYDRTVGWYSARFDMPFIRTRALAHGLEFPLFKQLVHTDAYDIAKRKLRLSSNRLKTVCQLLKIPSKQTELTPDLLVKARLGDPEHLQKILDHNVEDVISTAKVWEKLNGFTHLNKTSI